MMPAAWSRQLGNLMNRSPAVDLDPLQRLALVSRLRDTTGPTDVTDGDQRLLGLEPAKGKAAQAKG